MRSKVISIVAISAALLSIGITRAAGSGTFNGANIQDFTITANKLATGSVGTRAVANGSLLWTDLNAATIKALQVFGIRSGATIRGVIGGDYEVPTGTTCADNCDFGGYASLPFPAPAGLGDNDVLVDNQSWTTSGGQTRPALDASESASNAACNGTANYPKAPPGKVCIYIAGGDNAVDVKGVSVMPGTGKSPYGFKIVWVAAGPEDTFIDATWAYTAP